MKKYFFKENHYDRIPRKIKKKNNNEILTEKFLTEPSNNYLPCCGKYKSQTELTCIICSR